MALLRGPTGARAQIATTSEEDAAAATTALGGGYGFSNAAEDEDIVEPTMAGQGGFGKDWDWRTKFRTDAAAEARKWAEFFGYDTITMDSFVKDNIDGALQYINSKGLGRTSTTTVDPQYGAPLGGPLDPKVYQQMWDAGMTYFSLKAGFDLTGDIPGRGSGRRGSGSGAAAGPTAQEIRNMFDEDQLTDAATNMWRAWLIDEPPNARQIAKNYIEAVVASKGEKEIDFETFVQTKIKGTGRYSIIYKNKPEGLNELQYIQPYVQAAQSVMGGAGGNKKAIGNVVAGGAAVGASSDAFRGRLARTDENKNTTSFINDLEARMRAVKGVLRG